MIEKFWMDEIISGRKKHEYRKRCKFYDSRFLVPEPPTHLKLLNGYRRGAKYIVVKIKRIQKTKTHFIIHLA
jgi:hypothetical protein